MANTYRFTMEHFNGTDYDTMLPQAAYTTTVTLPASGWSTSTKSQTVTVNGVDADTTVMVSAAPASFEIYNKASIYCSAQAANSLTFKYIKVPSNDVVVNIAMF